MNVVVILAGGLGTRMQMSTAKQHLIVNNHQIIEYTLKAFTLCDAVDKILVVSNENYIEEVEKLSGKYNKLFKIVKGGKTRMLSVMNGVKSLLSSCNDDDKVIITDAARPCITIREINGLIESLDNYSAATTGIKSYETLLKVESCNVSQIIPRDGLVRQTSPEAYKFSVLKWLYIDADLQIINSYRNIGIDQLVGSGVKIGIVDSNPLNFKITTPEDVELFENVLKKGFENIINS